MHDFEFLGGGCKHTIYNILLILYVHPPPKNSKFYNMKHACYIGECKNGVRFYVYVSIHVLKGKVVKLQSIR